MSHAPPLHASVSQTSPEPVAASPSRRTSLLAGVLYLVTFATSVPTLLLYGPLDGRDFALGVGSPTSVLAGATLEVLLALSCVGTAVVLFPVVKQQSESAALGYLAARLVEGALILVGVGSLLSVITLRRDAAQLDDPSLVTAGQTLVAIHERLFLLSQSLMPVFCALFLGWALYRSRLVPRAIPLVGLAGAPLLLASDTAILWGSYSPDSTLAMLGALPIALWELSLAFWLLARGFLPAPPGAVPTQDHRPESADDEALA